MLDRLSLLLLLFLLPREQASYSVDRTYFAGLYIYTVRVYPPGIPTVQNTVFLGEKLCCSLVRSGFFPDFYTNVKASQYISQPSENVKITLSLSPSSLPQHFLCLPCLPFLLVWQWKKGDGHPQASSILIAFRIQTLVLGSLLECPRAHWYKNVNLFNLRNYNITSTRLDLPEKLYG